MLTRTVIRAHKDMQAEIDALDGNSDVTILLICSDGFCDSETLPSLNVKLPNLRAVQFEDVCMKQIHLTPELTPNVETISMQYPSEDDHPDFVIKCPKLKDFKCYHWGYGNNANWVNIMLEHATELESFDSYKLRVPYLKFASNHLSRIRLHRAELMYYLELYAPRLTDLNIQGCHELDEIQFLDTHPTLKLPKTFQFDLELGVNASNAILGHKARAAIRNHSRFYGEIKVEDEDSNIGLVIS